MYLLTLVIAASLMLTVAILIIGMSSLYQGGEIDKKSCEQLMFARVGMQRILFILLFVYILLFVALYIANI
jgi:preprotein translocase subunit SecG